MIPKKDLAFIGYSGHAYVCIETALLLNYNIIGYHDVVEVSNNPYQLSFLDAETQFEKHQGFLFISIGNNDIRSKIYKTISAIKTGMFVTLKHPTAIVSGTAQIGDNVLMSAGAIINALSKISNGCIINTGAIIEHECQLQKFAHIAPGAVLLGNVQVGARSFIGAGAVVKQGVRIGKDVVVGAGAVVIKDIPDHTTVVGNPAKKI